MMKNPQEYSIRGELVQMFIVAFFKILWDPHNKLREKLTLDSLVGLADEKAFLEVRSNEVCLEMYLTPLILPKKKVDNEVI